MQLAYKNSFLRQFKELPAEIQLQARSAMELFKNPRKHKTLRVHPLHGKLRGNFAFSVSNTIRIVFEYEDRKRVAILLAIGDHGIYD